MKKELLEWIKVIAISCIIALVITAFVKPTIVKNHSMSPTLEDNDFLLINRFFYNRGTPQRGDIVVFQTDLKTNNGTDKLLIKRIIALPGENLVIEEGNVYVDDVELEEIYLAENAVTLDTIDLVVPEGKIFTMGDNRLYSLDSRDPSLGLIDMDDILGKAFVRLYPFSRISTVK
ncbi:signal peptidase I [Serpentinicella sp. ANB-PHB4]|uniref:signal peptidase I n=1 Tax=Serpentinicella sp. ANB-PHB4 TaxID=3074076 RepID=UPI00285A9F43|nr:signal peptidase I [Serpentinicella sp. ANB-PHB4]MDR5659005.1 signal peptidase I [Serpentinicella sp. ANB-PHB4]